MVYADEMLYLGSVGKRRGEEGGGEGVLVTNFPAWWVGVSWGGPVILAETAATQLTHPPHLYPPTHLLPSYAQPTSSTTSPEAPSQLLGLIY